MRQTINTERLALRRVTLSDAKAISKLCGDKDIARMSSTLPHPFPELSAEFWVMMILERHRRALAFPYAITKDSGANDGGALIGVVDVFRRDADAALELGYWLGKPYWGQGFMLESCRAVIAEAQNTLGAARITAGVFADNPNSLRLLQKLGFKSHGSYERWFSMARQEKALGVKLALDLAKSHSAPPLLSQTKLVMSA